MTNSQEKASAMHSAHLATPRVTCPSCNLDFQPRRAWQRYCSVRCRNAWHRERQQTPALLTRVEKIEQRLAQLEAAQVSTARVRSNQLDVGSETGIANAAAIQTQK